MPLDGAKTFFTIGSLAQTKFELFTDVVYDWALKMYFKKLNRFISKKKLSLKPKTSRLSGHYQVQIV